MASMEVPPRMSERCLVVQLYTELFGELDDEPAAMLADVLGVLLDVLNGSLSSAAPLADAPTVGRLMLCCKSTLAGGECHPFWLGSIGFRLAGAGPPVDAASGRRFSSLRLFRLLSAEKKAAGDAGQWQRKLLTAAVAEGYTPPKGKLTSLHVSLSDEASEVFWSAQFGSFLALARMPTAAQAAEFKATTGLLLEMPGQGVGTVLGKAAELGQNKPLLASLVADLFSVARKAETAAVLKADPQAERYLHAVLSTGLDVVLFVPAILGGLTVDELMLTNWSKLGSKLKVNISRPLRRAMVNALAGQSWLSLYGCFAREGLVKAFFKSIRIGELLRPAKDPAHAKLTLLLSLVRRGALPGLGCDTYPGSAAEFAQPAWAVCVAAPLAELCANPAFEMPLVDCAGREGALWLSTEFVPELAGCRLQRPRLATVEAALSVSPDTAATWHRLVETPGKLTPNQVLSNLRNLIVAGVSPELAEAALCYKKLVPMATTAESPGSAGGLFACCSAPSGGESPFPVVDVGVGLTSTKSKAAAEDASQLDPTRLLKVLGLLEATFTQDYLAALKTDWLEAAPAADAPKGGGGDGEINPAVAAKAKQLWKLLGGGTPTDGAVIGVELATSEGSSLGEFVGPQGRVKFETVPEELAGISQPMALLRPWLQELAVAAGSPQGQPFNLSIEQFVGWFDGELKAAAADSWAAGGTAVIPMPAAYFRDKKGQVSEKAVLKRTTGPSAIANLAPMYCSMLGRLARAATGDTSKNQRVMAAICLTPELRNLARNGLPPAIPAYSRTSLWRNEAVCLQQLAAADESLDVLKVGITWTEAPGGGSRVDLDMSIMIYTPSADGSSWEFRDHCSYENLKTNGLTHSGDFTSAPHPEGARELVDVNVLQLRNFWSAGNTVPVFVAIVTFSSLTETGDQYSGQPMDDLFDASVFAANPSRPGNGPGRMDVLSAARLTGQGKVNISGLVVLDPPTGAAEEGLTNFYCIDHTLNANFSSASDHGGQKLVGESLQRTLAFCATAPTCKGLRLDSIAAQLCSLAGLGEVELWHAADQTRSPASVTVARQSDDGSEALSIDGMRAVLSEAAAGLERSYRPRFKPATDQRPLQAAAADAELDPAAVAAARPLVVFGGELDDVRELACAHPSLARQGLLTFVNLRASECIRRVVAVKELPLHPGRPGECASVVLIDGSDCLELLMDRLAELAALAGV